MIDPEELKIKALDRKKDFKDCSKCKRPKCVKPPFNLCYKCNIEIKKHKAKPKPYKYNSIPPSELFLKLVGNTEIQTI